MFETSQSESKGRARLTNATGIIEVLNRLNVGLELVAFVANIDPLIFHYLL